MSSKNHYVIATCVVLAAALGFGWQHTHSARRTETSLRVLNENLERLDAATRLVQEQISTRQLEVAALETKLRTATTAKATTSPNAETDTKAPPRLAVVTPLQKAVAGKGPAVKLNGPEFDAKGRADYLNQWKLLILPLTYRLMYGRLGLTPVEIEKFENLAVAHQDDLMTLQLAATAQGFNAQNSVSPGLAALILKSNEQFYATVAKEMGAELGTAVAQNDRLFDAQALVTSIEDRLLLVTAPDAPPFTPLQAAQLAQVIAEASPSYRTGGNSNLSDVDWDKACEEAAKLFSGGQLQAVQDIADLRRLQSRIKDFYGARYLR
jgi:hypothetical protein